MIDYDTYIVEKLVEKYSRGELALFILDVIQWLDEIEKDCEFQSDEHGQSILDDIICYQKAKLSDVVDYAYMSGAVWSNSRLKTKLWDAIDGDEILKDLESDEA